MTGALCGVETSSPATIEGHAGAQLTTDSNIYRQSAANALASGGGIVSDRIAQFDGGLNATFETSNLTGEASANVLRQIYQHNSFLDNTGFSARIAATEAGQLLDANLLGSFGQALSSFGDILARVRNVQRLGQISGRVGINVTPEFRGLLDGTYVSSLNSSPILKQQDYQQKNLGFGLGYFTTLDNSIVVKASRTSANGLNDRITAVNGGSIVDRIRYIDRSIDLQALYHISTITFLTGDLSYVRRKDRSLVGRPFDGLVGSLRLDYKPSEALSAAVTVGRRLDTASLVFTDSVRRTFATLTANYKPTSRSELTGLVDFERRRTTYDPLAFVGATGRRDDTSSLSLRGSYDLFRALSLSVDGAYQRRTSSETIFGFHDVSGTLSLRYRFGHQQNEGQ